MKYPPSRIAFKPQSCLRVLGWIWGGLSWQTRQNQIAMEIVVPYDPLGINRNGGFSSELISHRDTADSPDSARGVLSWPILWWSHCCSSERMRHLTDTRDNYRENLSQRQEIWKSIRMIVVIYCSCWFTFMRLWVFLSVFVFVVRVSSCGWLFVHILCICATLCNQKMRKQCRQPPKIQHPKHLNNIYRKKMTKTAGQRWTTMFVWIFDFRSAMFFLRCVYQVSPCSLHNFHLIEMSLFVQKIILHLSSIFYKRTRTTAEPLAKCNISSEMGNVQTLANWNKIKITMFKKWFPKMIANQPMKNITIHSR